MLKERTYGAVKRMILAGTLRPGNKLAERDLSRRLKVSRTPLTGVGVCRRDRA